MKRWNVTWKEEYELSATIEALTEEDAREIASFVTDGMLQVPFEADCVGNTCALANIEFTEVKEVVEDIPL